MKKDLKKCVEIVVAAAKDAITMEQAATLVDRMVNSLDGGDASANLANAEMRVKELGEKIIESDKLHSSIQRRNQYLTIMAKRRTMEFVRKFPTPGEGLRAYMNGINKTVRGGRRSIYYQQRAIMEKYVGQFVDGLERLNLVREFKSGSMDQDIFRELWELGREGGHPGITKNGDATNIARLVNRINLDMVARSNRAGSYIRPLPGYIMRQTHDPVAIRRAGGLGIGRGSKEASFRVWSEFILPLLDHEKTFGDVEDKLEFLKGAHDGILSGIHLREETAPVDVNAEFAKRTGALARKVSAPRVLHFKDADSAFAYNQRFGAKEFREMFLRGLQQRSRSIAMMENLGPNPDTSFHNVVRDLKVATREHPEDLKMLRSLEDWRVEASFRELMGLNDISVNPSLTRIAASVRSLQNMAKLGTAVLTSIADKAFFQSEMSYQGIRGLRIFGKQIEAVLEGRHSGERKSMLNLMGASVDGFINQVSHRFNMHDNEAGLMSRLQAKFFDINGMNWWNDVHRGAAAELMSAHLAEHASLATDKLPLELRRMLDLYDINPREWDLIRSTVTEVGERQYVAPDGLLKLTDAQIDAELTILEKPITESNRLRYRDELETKLRTYFADRLDMAIPTPGNAERLYARWNTQAGTPLGEAMRLIMLFKAMPVTVLTKIVGREIYGRGADSMMQWLRNDHLGKFKLTQLVAMATVMGYLSGMIKDLIRGRTPKDITNPMVLQDAMLRGGGFGIYGDLLFTQYDRSYRSFLATAAGPVLGQMDNIADIISRAKSGQKFGTQVERLATENTPFINLFYIRPAIDYLVLWNLHEMVSPGSLRVSERNIMRQGVQGFYIRPSEHINR